MRDKQITGLHNSIIDNCSEAPDNKTQAKNRPTAIEAGMDGLEDLRKIGIKHRYNQMRDGSRSLRLGKEVNPHLAHCKHRVV